MTLAPLVPRAYNLVAVAGMTPQVLTECVWALAQPPFSGLPSSVHVVTTGDGARFVRARLLGESLEFRYKPIEGIGHRWSALAAALGDGALPDPVLHVPMRHGVPILDVSSVDDDSAMAGVCYDVVDRVARGPLPLVCCIAGGRKTMSGHLQTAFSVLARPGDRLVHVLVRPDRYEHGDFFFPDASTPDAIIDLVDIRTPRLYRVLQGGVLPRSADDRRDLGSILTALEPINYPIEPDRAVVLAGIRPRGGSLIQMLRGSEVLAECPITAACLATLLVLLEFESSAGTVKALDLLDRPHVDAVRRATQDLCGFRNQLTNWAIPAEISRNRNALAECLAKVPMASDFLGFASEGGDGTGGAVYRRQHRLPVSILAMAGMLKSPLPFRNVKVEVG